MNFETIAILAPKAYEALKSIKTHKTDEQVVFLLALLYDTMVTQTRNMLEIEQMNSKKLDLLLGRAK